MSDFNATKELIKFVVEMIQAIEKSVAEGLSIVDAVNFVKPMLLAIDVFKDIEKVPSELKNLTTDQLQELYDAVAADLSQGDKTQQIIEKSLEIGLKVFELYKYTKS